MRILFFLEGTSSPQTLKRSRGVDSDKDEDDAAEGVGADLRRRMKLMEVLR